MKIAFYHKSIHSQHNDRLKGVTKGQFIFCVGESKGQSAQFIMRVISIMECVNNNEDTKYLIHAPPAIFSIHTHAVM